MNGAESQAPLMLVWKPIEEQTRSNEEATYELG